jgi:hypothetical protein
MDRLRHLFSLLTSCLHPKYVEPEPELEPKAIQEAPSSPITERASSPPILPPIRSSLVEDEQRDDPPPTLQRFHSSSPVDGDEDEDGDGDGEPYLLPPRPTTPIFDQMMATKPAHHIFNSSEEPEDEGRVENVRNSKWLEIENEASGGEKEGAGHGALRLDMSEWESPNKKEEPSPGTKEGTRHLGRWESLRRIVRGEDGRIGVVKL